MGTTAAHSLIFLISWAILATTLSAARNSELCAYDPGSSNLCMWYHKFMFWRSSGPYFYYSAARNSCLQYRACDSDNRFTSYSKCMAHCELKPTASQTKPPPCLEEVDAGPCRASQNMYYYDLTTDSCKLFLYGGCEGNKNRFQSEEQCQSLCVSNP